MNWQQIREAFNLPMYEWVRIPPHETWGSLVNNPDYLIATRFFLHNAGLVMLAMVIGLGVIASLMKPRQAPADRGMGIGILAFMSIGAGLAIMIFELFLLGLGFWLTPTVVSISYGVTAILALLAIAHKRHIIRQWVGSPAVTPHSLIAIIFLVLVAVIQYGSVTGPTLGDATSYHAPYADYMLQQHGLAIHEYLIYPYHSLNINLLYTLGLMIEHDLSYLQSINALFTSLTMLGIYLLARALGVRHGIAIILPLVMIQLYVVRFNRLIANVDMGGMFFVFSAVLPLLLWRMHGKPYWLLAVSALSLGTAMGSKYILCIMAFSIGIYLLLECRKQVIKPLAYYVGWAALFGLGWYIRNWILTGNPVHPFAPGIFGYYLWDEADFRQQMQPILNSFIPRSAWGLLALPWHAYTSPVLLNQHVVIFLGILHINTIASLLVRSKANILLLFYWPYLVFWVWGSQDPRHFIPIIPLILVHFAGIMETVLSQPDRLIRHTLGDTPSKAPAILLCILALSFAAYDARDKLYRVYYSSLHADSTADAKKRYYRPDYDLIMHAKEFFAPEETIYEFAMRDARWFYHGDMAGTNFGPHGYWKIITAAAYKDGRGGIDPERLQSILQERYQASGFVIPNQTDDPGTSLPYQQAKFDAYFDLLYKNEMGAIYRFRSH